VLCITRPNLKHPPLMKDGKMEREGKREIKSE
jgi:hypothetical protein